MNTETAQSIAAILTACGCNPETVNAGNGRDIVKVNAPTAPTREG